MIDQYRAEIIERETHGGEMVTHLMSLFEETCAVRPKLVVELGVRKGMSTFALERAARLSGAKMVSVDREDSSAIVDYTEFVQAEDVEFASRFGAFCEERRIEPVIDVLLVDTSHTYAQTQAEIKAWVPLMAQKCKLMFHDTNPSPKGWNKADPEGRYGVASAIDEWLGRKFPWKTYFRNVVGEWSIRHNPEYMGLTILNRGLNNG